jgi:hypothetical protein
MWLDLFIVGATVPVVFHSVELPITLMLHLSVFHCLGLQDSGPDATSFLSAYLPLFTLSRVLGASSLSFGGFAYCSHAAPACFFVALNSKTLALTPPRLWALISDPSGNLNWRT